MELKRMPFKALEREIHKRVRTLETAIDEANERGYEVRLIFKETALDIELQRPRKGQEVDNM